MQKIDDVLKFGEDSLQGTSMSSRCPHQTSMICYMANERGNNSESNKEKATKDQREIFEVRERESTMSMLHGK